MLEGGVAMKTKQASGLSAERVRKNNLSSGVADEILFNGGCFPSVSKV
jgi:hypothetical protein